MVFWRSGFLTALSLKNFFKKDMHLNVDFKTKNLMFRYQINIFIDDIFSMKHKMYWRHCIFIQMPQYEKINVSIIL